ncbi:MAG: orotidine-5'-phosphate decarboxylase, partial [Myxococcota bacterium]
MNSFFARLEDHARTMNSLLCVGLDPHPEDLSEPTGAAARDFCLRLIEQTADLAVAYKPNAAFFEALGAEGWSALHAVIAAVPKETPVLLDAKRGDIASTARAYARASFEQLGADAITLNPYLGRDAIAPFIDDPARGAFVLCKTSNPGSTDLQDRLLADQSHVYDAIAEEVQRWNQVGNNVGLVIGATHPDVLGQIRARAPELWVLAPGIGAQGG